MCFQVYEPQLGLHCQTSWPEVTVKALLGALLSFLSLIWQLDLQPHPNSPKLLFLQPSVKLS